MTSQRVISLILMVAVLWLSFEAWLLVAPGLEQGWLSGGVVGRIFFPIVLLLGVAIWLWRR